MSDCHTREIVKARKRHSCECHRVRRGAQGNLMWNHRRAVSVRRCYIESGQYYELESGIFDGEPFRLRTCIFHRAVGLAIWARMSTIERDGGIFYDEIQDDVECEDFVEWSAWLRDIRAEYRKLKSEVEKKAAARRGSGP